MKAKSTDTSVIQTQTRMVHPLPISNFEWSDERDVDQLIIQYVDNEMEGCFVQCDLEYPIELHDDHNAYPLAPERKLVTEDMLSPYAKYVLGGMSSWTLVVLMNKRSRKIVRFILK